MREAYASSEESPSGMGVSWLVYETAYCWNDPSTENLKRRRLVSLTWINQPKLREGDAPRALSTLAKRLIPLPAERALVARMRDPLDTDAVADLEVRVAVGREGDDLAGSFVAADERELVASEERKGIGVRKSGRKDGREGRTEASRRA